VQGNYDHSKPLDPTIYMCSFVGVHACTCSCVTSALLYRVANDMSDDEAPNWFVLSLPMMKFGIGW
jgi:hypothetical protein